MRRHQEGLDAVFSVRGFRDDESRQDAFEKLSFTRYGRADGTIPVAPYIDVCTGEVLWLPVALNREAYGSNGMTSGNTANGWIGRKKETLFNVGGETLTGVYEFLDGQFGNFD